MEFWTSRLQIFQDLTHIIPLPLCWDSIEYFKEGRPASRLVCLLDIPGLSSINGCSGKILTLGLWCHLSNYADIQNILSHKKCMFPFIVILGKDSSQEKIRIIWFKMKSWMILLLFRLWILQSSGSSWQYIKEWVYVLFCATADPKLAMRDSGYGKQNWATICGKQQDPLGLKSHIWLFSVLLPPGHNRCWFCWKQCE